MASRFPLCRSLLCLLLLTGIAQADAPPPPYRLAASVSVSEPSFGESYIVTDDRIYLATRENVIALDPKSMKVLWSVPVAKGKEYLGHLAVDRGVLYVATNSGHGSVRSHLVALNPTSGKTLWTFEREGPTSEMAFENGRVYLMSEAKTLACLDLASRAVLWRTSSTCEHPNVKEARLCLSDSSVIVNYDSITSCVDKETGLVRWAEPQSYLWSTSPIASGDTVWIPAKKGSVARNARTGQVLWRNPHSPSRFAAIFGGRFVGLDQHLVCLDSRTGEEVWTLNLPSDGTTGSEFATIVDDHLFVDSAARITLVVDGQGKVIWSSDTAERAIPLPAWSDQRHLVSLSRGRLMRFEHGEEPELPTEPEAKVALAKKLASQFDLLDASGRKRLRDLGPEAFQPTLTAFVSSVESDKYGADPSELYEILEAISRPANAPAIRDVLRKAPAESSPLRQLFEILSKIGEPSEDVPFCIAEVERVRGLGEPISYIFLAEQYLFQSSHPQAVAYMLSQLEDPTSPLRQSAYYNLAGTGGPKELQAVLAKRKARKLQRPLTERILETWSPSKDAPPVRQKDSADAQSWALLRSKIIGHHGDLWLVKKVAGKWAHPAFTGLISSPYDESSISDATRALLDGPWQQHLASNPDLFRDTDGDGLTDLVEDRLGTDAHNPDTDGDGAPDIVDPWPNALVRADLTEAEQVLAAAYEAQFHFSAEDGAAVFYGQPGMRPFEMVGGPPVTIWQTRQAPRARTPLETCYPRGTAIIEFTVQEKEAEGTERLIKWNPQRTEATVELNVVHAPFAGVGFQMVVRKFGSDWVVVSHRTTWVS